ncbi:hypothetical protein MNBD_GAMMA16-1794 [hydrothermal vent metagenome]|uniref:Lipoprotein SmpA/OmlA domain-containing protein n=1 Tax=hydrothermal vent metagenome TaxID=652676 RepID=A0A3B0Z207_9ZZZZ
MTKIRTSRKLAALMAILFFSIGLSSHSTEMATVPVLGATMSEVEKQRGAPVRMFPPVGQPPITRWVYNDYTLYFEYELVIQSVPNLFKTKRAIN